MSQAIRDRLADINWFIKGMIHAGDDTFWREHTAALADAQEALVKQERDAGKSFTPEEYRKAVETAVKKEGDR